MDVKYLVLATNVDLSGWRYEGATNWWVVHVAQRMWAMTVYDIVTISVRKYI